MDLRFTWAPSPADLAAAARRAARDEASGVTIRLVSEKDRATEQGKLRRTHHRLADPEGRDLDEDEARRRIDPYVKRPVLWRYTEEWRGLPRVSAAAVLEGCRRVQALRDTLAPGLLMP